jgi:hypothetical protein
MPGGDLEQESCLDNASMSETDSETSVPMREASVPVLNGYGAPLQARDPRRSRSPLLLRYYSRVLV